MKLKNIVSIKILFIVIGLTGTVGIAKQLVVSTDPIIRVVGAMRNVMKKGQLQGVIELDTITDKSHLYGIGPEEYLKGELLIMDGKSYKANIKNNKVHVEETFKVKAPFFVYANVPAWEEAALPATVKTMKELELYLDKITKDKSAPFAFKLEGVVESADFHLVNLAEGAQVNSAEDAHRGNVNFMLSNEAVVLVGFFSREHKSIFTHHDTFMHIHLISADKQKMGHLDDVILKKGSVKLFLPKR